MAAPLGRLLRAATLAGASLAGVCLPAGAAVALRETPVRDERADPARGEVRDAEWFDARRGRSIPVRLRVPATGEGAVPVILFSHGLGGSREGGTLWGEHWAAHGYLVVHLQHPGSDEGLWRGQAGAPAQAMKSLRAGANARQLLARVDDVKFVLDELARRKAAGDPALRRADLSRVGMSGHSFGALSTLALSGQRYVGAGGGEPFLLEPRIKAAIAFSPNARGPAGDAARQFGSIAIPVLSVTGTRDGDVIGDGTTPEARTRPFAAMPPPGKYLAVFEGGDHGVFGGHVLRRPATARDGEIQGAVRAITLAFWDAWLKNDGAARAWLADGGARASLHAGDRLEAKP